MSTLDDLVEVSDINKFKTFIKTFILENETLFRLIFFSDSNPLDETCIYPDNPYEIFDNTDNTHGIVLFDRKNDSILNNECVNLLIDFESTKVSNSKKFDQLYIIFRIIVKGTNIRKLENGLDRSYTIAKLIDDEFNLSSINGLGEVIKQSISPLSLNEENIGYSIIYKGFSFNSTISSNKNFKKRISLGR